MIKQRILYFDYLRFISIIAVLIIHVTAPSLPMSVDDMGWQINLVFNSMARFGVPMFFMISGALFLNPARDVSLGYLWIKIRRIVIAFLLFSFIYNCLWYVATIGLKYNEELFVRKFIPNLIGGWYHLWYLQALFVLYVLIPILRLIVKDRIIMRYMILLLFIVCSLFPLIGRIIDIQLFTSNLFENMAIDLPKYSLYFLLGYYVNTISIEKTKQKKSNNLILIIGLISFFIMIMSDILLSTYNGNVIIVFSSYMSPFTVVYTVCLFNYLKNRYNNSNLITKFVSFVSSLSFGIYLVHDFFLIIAREIKIIPFYEYAVVKIPIMVMIVLLLSTLLSFILKKVPYLTKCL